MSQDHDPRDSAPQGSAPQEHDVRDHAQWDAQQGHDQKDSASRDSGPRARALQDPASQGSMSDAPRLLLGVFGTEEDILAATRASRKAGLVIHDVYTPYAVHGLSEEMGLAPSRLTWVCLAFALCGLALAVSMQFWISAIDWPLNVGGKPFNSFPAFLPITFELTVLLGGLGTVAVLFARAKLYPGKVELLADARVTDDRFVLAVRTADPAFDAESVQRLWQGCGLVEARSAAARRDGAASMFAVKGLVTKALIVVPLVLAGAVLLVGQILAQHPDRRTWQYFPDMAHTLAYKAQSPNPSLTLHQTQHSPPEGTISRGAVPFHYGPSVADYVRAGRELTSPFGLGHPAKPERGREVYRTFCQPCHGAQGRGDGLVVRAGFPAPPSLLFGKALNMNDGHIFYIITVGWRKMPSYAAQIEPEDRWAAIAYLRSLQENRPWN